MRSTPHVLLGAAAGLALTHALDPAITWPVTAAAAVASVLPDVDQYWAPRDKPIPGSVQDWLIAHRGPTHSLLASAALYFGMLALHRPDIALGLALGYASHLLLDMLNYEGCPLFWPLPVRLRLLPYGLRLRSGAVIELPLSAAALAFALDWSGVYVLPFLPTF